MFDASFKNVLTVLDRKVDGNGRIFGMSKHKGCKIAVVVLDDGNRTIDGTITFGGGIEQQELRGDYHINPPTEELVEITSEEIAAAFGSKGE